MKRRKLKRLKYECVLFSNLSATVDTRGRGVGLDGLGKSAFSKAQDPIIPSQSDINRNPLQPDQYNCASPMEDRDSSKWVEMLRITLEKNTTHVTNKDLIMGMGDHNYQSGNPRTQKIQVKGSTQFGIWMIYTRTTFDGEEHHLSSINVLKDKINTVWIPRQNL